MTELMEASKNTLKEIALAILEAGEKHPIKVFLDQLAIKDEWIIHQVEVQDAVSKWLNGDGGGLLKVIAICRQNLRLIGKTMAGDLTIIDGWDPEAIEVAAKAFETAQLTLRDEATHFEDLLGAINSLIDYHPTLVFATVMSQRDNYFTEPFEDALDQLSDGSPEKLQELLTSIAVSTRQDQTLTSYVNLLVQAAPSIAFLIKIDAWWIEDTALIN